MANGPDGERAEMTPEAMKARTMEFGLRCLKLSRRLPNDVEGRVVRSQLVRCATSVGANYRAAQRARSKAEFRAKLGIVEEECDESCFWLELIMQDGMLPEKRVQPLHDEGREVLAIICAALRTARRR